MSSHWIVQVKRDGNTFYGHIESETQPAGILIIAVEVGPRDTAEAAWAEWHKKHGNLKLSEYIPTTTNQT